MPHDLEGSRRRGADTAMAEAPDGGTAKRNSDRMSRAGGADPLKVLALTKYDNMAASSRYRFLNYVPLLEASGIDVTVAPLLSNDYVARRQTNRRVRWPEVGGAFLRRFRTILKSRRFDVVWLEGELFPKLPALIERLLNQLDIPFVVDIDDAIFHAYDHHPSTLYRAMMGRKIDVVMSRAQAVIAGNAYLARRAQQAGARHVVQVPTAIDHVAYLSALGEERPAASRKNGQLTIGWIGSPVTAHYLRHLEEPLAQFTNERESDLVLVGAGDVDLKVDRLVKRPWSPQRELSDIASFDIGIAPLADGAWERGKCGLKAIQYMGMGVPVVASDCGALPAILGEQPATGLLYRDDAEFYDCLDRLAEDRGLRSQLGENGRRRVEEEYSIHRWAGIVADTLRGAA